MKKILAILLTGSLIFGALCSCSNKSDLQNTSSLNDIAEKDNEADKPYSVTITSEDVDGVSALPVACEYVDGDDSIEIYYISFGCDIDGLSLERVDENFKTIKTLFTTQTIKSGTCLKLTTNTPEGFPNMRVVVTCGENEYRYLLAYNGRDGGANLIDEQEFKQELM